MDSSAENTLEIMRGWDWQGITGEGETYLRFKQLSEVVNRLGFDGHPRPSEAVLELLCTGNLHSCGQIAWKKYQNGHRFELNEGWAIIQSSRWQQLSDLIEKNRESFSSKQAGLEPVQFECISSDRVAPFSWAFNQNHFRTAVTPDGLALFDEGYFEEEFSAWKIDIWPDDDVATALQKELRRLNQSSELEAQNGGRPPANWWPDFAEELAIYIFECGIPEGDGVRGQSAMLNAICDRLAANGKSEPGRSTVQPVINAVLRRARAAGN